MQSPGRQWNNTLESVWEEPESSDAVDKAPGQVLDCPEDSWGSRALEDVIASFCKQRPGSSDGKGTIRNTAASLDRFTALGLRHQSCPEYDVLGSPQPTQLLTGQAAYQSCLEHAMGASHLQPLHPSLLKELLGLSANIDSSGNGAAAQGAIAQAAAGPVDEDMRFSSSSGDSGSLLGMNPFASCQMPASSQLQHAVSLPSTTAAGPSMSFLRPLGQEAASYQNPHRLVRSASAFELYETHDTKVRGGGMFSEGKVRGGLQHWGSKKLSTDSLQGMLSCDRNSDQRVSDQGNSDQRVKCKGSAFELLKLSSESNLQSAPEGKVRGGHCKALESRVRGGQLLRKPSKASMSSLADAPSGLPRCTSMPIGCEYGRSHGSSGALASLPSPTLSMLDRTLSCTSCEGLVAAATNTPSSMGRIIKVKLASSYQDIASSPSLNNGLTTAPSLTRGSLGSTLSLLDYAEEQVAAKMGCLSRTASVSPGSSIRGLAASLCSPNDGYSLNTTISPRSNPWCSLSEDFCPAVMKSFARAS